ncbi:MAG TPA: VOC family protein [Dehalococcoidia bacterium]|nr:VOC family protein [Dehalococcoidia bacterium]
MLQRVDRVQLAVRDREAAAETFAHVLGAVRVRQDRVSALTARRTVLQAGESEFELLEPEGDGSVANFVERWGEGLYAAGFSTADVQALAARFDAEGVWYAAEGDQLFIGGDQTFGMPVVVSPAAPRERAGLITWLYEVTNVVGDWQAAAERYTRIFGLDPARFCPIDSPQYGYRGTLTLFDPPNCLDRIEITQTYDPEKPMARFHARRGDSLYMCFAETDDAGAIERRLRERNLRYAYTNPRNPAEGLFIHPSALHGMLMGISLTNVAWVWSGRPDLAPAGSQPH